MSDRNGVILKQLIIEEMVTTFCKRYYLISIAIILIHIPLWFFAFGFFFTIGGLISLFLPSLLFPSYYLIIFGLVNIILSMILNFLSYNFFLRMKNRVLDFEQVTTQEVPHSNSSFTILIRPIIHQLLKEREAMMKIYAEKNT
jgi:K+-sensing histidine kinase KdpD